MSRRSHQRGFSLLVVSLSITALLGAAGLAVDGGRLMLVRNQLQAFADTAALAAAAELDGTDAGLQAARRAIEKTPRNVDLDTQPQTRAQFGPTSVRLTVVASIPFYFLRALPGAVGDGQIAVSAAAKQAPVASLSAGGLTPFLPAAHDPADHTHFGLVPGRQYTLLWDKKHAATCPGDDGFKASSAAGFADLGQGLDANLGWRAAIISNDFPNPGATVPVVRAGTLLDWLPADQRPAILSAVAARIRQDTDQSSAAYTEYRSAGKGNRRRLIVAPIHDPAAAIKDGVRDATTVIGFGAFLLPPASRLDAKAGCLCAEYVGPALLNGAKAAAEDGTQVYTLRLYQ